MQGVPGMQFRKRCSAFHEFANVANCLRRPEGSSVLLRLRTAVPAFSLFCLLALGVVPSPVRVVSSAEAQSCTPPAFWNPFNPGGGRCEVYMCAEGFTLDVNICRKEGVFPPYAASCPVGWGVTAVENPGWPVYMRCVDPSPPEPPRPVISVRVRRGPPLTRADPPTTPVSATRVRTLPFTVSETGVSSEKSYSFRLDSRTEVILSLTGMNRDIDCRVNSSSCTNRGGTSDDSWSGTLAAATHTVTVYPYGGGSGNWTLSVSAETPTSVTSPPLLPPSTPSSPPTTVRRTLETRVGLVFATETDSPGQTYSFTLESSQTVSVSLTGMNRDIDCSVNGSRCSNRGGTSDDDWSRELAAGSHSVRVYPYRGGTGDYTIMAVVNCPAGHFASGGSCYRYVVPSPSSATAASGTEVQECDENTQLEEGQECVNGVVVFSEEIVVVDTPIPVPRPGQPIPPPTPTPTPNPLPPPPPPLPSWVTPSMQTQLATAVADATARARSCSVTPNSGDEKNAYSALIAAQIQYDGPLCPGYAHADAIGGTTIHICREFFPTLVSPPAIPLTAPEQSLTIMHEGLHLEGVRHSDFGVNTAPSDDDPMDDAIRSACGYPPWP